MSSGAVSHYLSDVPRRGIIRPNLHERGPDFRHRPTVALEPCRNRHPARRGTQCQDNQQEIQINSPSNALKK